MAHASLTPYPLCTSLPILLRARGPWVCIKRQHQEPEKTVLGALERTCRSCTDPFLSEHEFIVWDLEVWLSCSVKIAGVAPLLWSPWVRGCDCRVATGKGSVVLLV